MRTFAYCAHSFKKSVRQAAGVSPLLSPPVTLDAFEPHWLLGYDFLYFKLHGLPGQEYWYGDKWTTALSADVIRQVDLTGTIVFVANCHLYEDEPGKQGKKLASKNFPGPMLTALLAAGARYVVGGPGENYAKREKVYGADLLGMSFRLLCQLGISPKRAFTIARTHIRVKPHKDLATRDSLDFRIFDNSILEGENYG